MKELQESKRALRLIRKIDMIRPPSRVDSVLAESDELTRIFATSIRTAKRRVGEARRSGKGGD
jgi:hypothetical protein